MTALDDANEENGCLRVVPGSHKRGQLSSLSAEEKRAAGRHWLRIAAAHELLIDEQKRMPYDELGPEDFVTGL